MSNVLFANIGWMTHYRGNSSHDHIVGGGSYRDDDKHEAFNFLPINGKCFGHVQTVKSGHIRLDRISAKFKGSKLEDVLVIWTAHRPNAKGNYIVGWYEHATVYSEYRESSSKARNGYRFNIVTNANNSVLLPVDHRVFQIPRATEKEKGFLGRSGVWYADSKRKAVQDFKKKVLSYIQRYSNSRKDFPRQALKVDAEARKRVEQAAIAFVTKEYKKLGYTITSREKENLGWDLDAKKGAIELQLEVKGLAQSQISVRITKNEHDFMMSNKASYRLCVVTNALNNPTLIKFLWDHTVKSFVSETNPDIALSIEERPSYLAEVK